MPSLPDVQDARSQLRALTTPGASRLAGLDGLPVAARSRDAAVLILFGALDARPSAHAAREPAVSRDLDVLLLARASTLRSHPGQVAFPGGRVDAGDADPVAAALREAEEETGLDPDGVEVLGALEPIPLAYSRHIVTPVLAWWQRPSDVRVVDEAESAAVFRAPVADLLDPDNRGVTVLRGPEGEWRNPGFLVHSGGQDFLVWGFTAMLLNALFDALEWTEPWDDTHELPRPLV